MLLSLSGNRPPSDVTEADNTSTSNRTTFPLPNHPGRERTGENEPPITTVFLDDRLPSRTVRSLSLTVGGTLAQQPDFIKILPDGPRHVVQGVIMPMVVVFAVATVQGCIEGIDTRHVELQGRLHAQPFNALPRAKRVVMFSLIVSGRETAALTQWLLGLWGNNSWLNDRSTGKCMSID